MKDLPSTASWLMIAVIDGLLFAATIAAEKPFWFPLSYVVGATFAVVALFIRGTWRWSRRETFCAIAAVVSLYLWQTRGAVVGVCAGAVALTAAGIPMFVEMIYHPIRDMFSTMVFLSLACVFTLLGSDGSLAGTALPWSSLGFNIPLALLTLRRKKTGVPS